MNEGKWLKIKLQQLQILHQNRVIQSYFSITFNERLYFSHVIDDQISLQLKGDIIIPIENINKLDKFSLQRWQSHVIVFDHEIVINELKTKAILNKKYQTKKDQILTFSISLCTQKDIIVCQSIIKKISQHYLMLQEIKLKDQKKSSQRPDLGACFFQIKTSSNQFNIPVSNGNILINLPQTLQISQYKNNKLYSNSKHYTFEQLGKMVQQIQLYSENNNNEIIGKLSFKAHWLIDMTVNSPIQYLLLHSNQFLLYEFQLKFDIPSDFIGTKLKISSNNKMFQFSDQLGTNKMIKIKKAIWIVTKAQNDSIQIAIQRNGNIICKFDILTQSIQYYSLIKYKQKLFDINNSLKPLGIIKFNLQKSKGRNHLQNDQFWKQSIKKKINTILQIQQLSLYYQYDENLSIVIKTQTEQKTIQNIQNINFFQQDPLIYHNPVIISPKSDQIIYLMIKQQKNSMNQLQKKNNNNQDFIGIGVLNVNDIRLGNSPYQIDFYKNQQKLGTINLLITKYSSLNFIKSSFQPQLLPFGKTLDLKLSMNTLTLSGYFFSYKYDNQNQVFCIIEVNRLKKVLILQPTFQQLSFVPASSSDLLSFSIQADQIIKVKITIMVGDGLNQIIYGTKSFSINLQQLRQKQQIQIKEMQFYNYTDTYVGKCNLNFIIIKQTIKKYQQAINKQKIISKRNNKSSQQKSNKQHKKKSVSVADYLNSQQIKQVKIVKNLLPTKKYTQKDYNKSLDIQKRGTHDSKSKDINLIKLPKIKQSKSKQILNDIFISMNMRKKTLGGYDYNNNKDSSNINSNRRYEQDKSSRQINSLRQITQSKDKSIDYNILKNNSNMDRNFQILFPAKKTSTRQEQIKNQLNKYQQKLKGLKSVLQQISNDIGPIQPSIKQGNNTQSMGQTNKFEYAGNQFI